jgi:hypothetical protein
LWTLLTRYEVICGLSAHIWGARVRIQDDLLDLRCVKRWAKARAKGELAVGDIVGLWVGGR